MLQLVYISSARMLITDATCRDILSISRRNNERDGISGLLVAGQRRYLQALEGKTDVVRAAYQRIRADPRHYACVLLGEHYIDDRMFGAWDMGFQQGGRELSDDASLAAVVTNLVAPISDANLRAQFVGFAELQERAA